MSAPALPTSPLHRTIGIEHWRHGLAKFNGNQHVLVAKHASGFQSHWIFTIEKIENEVYCVTRYNDKLISKRKAADL